MQRLKWFVAGVVFTLILFLIFWRAREESPREHEEHGAHGEHGKHGEESSAIKVSQAAQDLLELQFTPVEEMTPEKQIAVVGEIAQDPERIEHVVSSREGSVVSLRVPSGAVVKKGEVLATVAPKGVATAVEITSPLDGIVLAKHVKEGERVDTITSIYTVADLSELSANFNVYEKDIGRIRRGQRILIRSIAYPEKTFQGLITFISPRIEEETHTIRIRAAVENPDYLLKLGMFVSGEIICEEEQVSLTVPLSALYLLDGKKGVFVKMGENEFEARPITIGQETDTTVTVISGLKKGESVVSGNAFLLKSELLKAKLGAGCAE